ncbi:MAG: hypothetical protein DMG06_17795 [Acidobacteria bacterium]|nr:MAG: hypothetical protein DMG06_17795 [Acidobacteriota bacterium]
MGFIAKSSGNAKVGRPSSAAGQVEHCPYLYIDPTKKRPACTMIILAQAGAQTTQIHHSATVNAKR